MVCQQCHEADHGGPCPNIDGVMVATLAFACAICSVRFDIGKDILVRVTDAARPVSMRLKWMHAACVIRMLRSRDRISAEAHDTALRSYERLQSGVREDQTGMARATDPGDPPLIPDEHTPIVRFMAQCRRGTNVHAEAGAGSGKTTLCERVIVALARRENGERAIRLALSSTRAGCRALTQRAGIPDHIVFTLHALGLQALTNVYQSTASSWHCDDEDDGLEIRLRPRSVGRCSSKHTIILHYIVPPSEYDRGRERSLHFLVNAAFVVELADKQLLFGFGVPGRPDYDEQVAKYDLVNEFGFEAKTESAYERLAPEDAHQYSASFPTPMSRLLYAMHLTSTVLYESVDISRNPTWRGRQTWGLDSKVRSNTALHRQRARLIALAPAPTLHRHG